MGTNSPITPTIGRIVMFRNRAKDVCPAIITQVNEDGTLDLTIFPHQCTPMLSNRIPYTDDVLDKQEDPGDVSSECPVWFWPPRA